MKLKAKISISLVFLFIFLICITGCSKKEEVKQENITKHEKITAQMKQKTDDNKTITGNLEIIFQNNTANDGLFVIEYPDLQSARENYNNLITLLALFSSEDYGENPIQFGQNANSIFIRLNANVFNYILVDENKYKDTSKESVKAFLQAKGYKIISEGECDRNSFDDDSRIFDISSREIYLDDDATDEQIDELKRKINSFDDVTDIEYIDKKQAYYNAVEKLGESAVGLVGYTETDHPFPRTLRIKVKSGLDVNKILDAANEFDFVIGTDLDN